MALTTIETEALNAATEQATTLRRIADMTEESLCLQEKTAQHLETQALINYLAVLKQPIDPDANIADINFLDTEIRDRLRL